MGSYADVLSLHSGSSRSDTAERQGQQAVAADLQAKQQPHRVASGRNNESKLPDPLVWIDLEMTGLDSEKDVIMQIACIVSDGQLKTIIEGPEIVIHVGEPAVQGMNEWCQEHHHKSGLVQRCRDSEVSLAEAEAQILEFVRSHVPEARQGLLAGNTVHCDLMFLRTHMPALAAHLHYRICDVSTVSELAKRWFRKEWYRAPKKKNTHTALSDIRESIQELKYYRAKIFKAQQGQ